MTAVTHNRFLLPAWAVSLTLHAAVVALAVLFAAQVRPIVQEESFKWDVALVETVKTASPSEQTPQPEAKPTQPLARAVQPQLRPAPPVEPPPDTVMHRVAPQQTVQMVHPQAQPPKPLEQREEPPPPPKVEPMTPVAKPLEEKSVEPVEQRVAEIPKTMPEPVMPPTQSTEPVIAQRQPVPPTEAVESRPLETHSASAPAPIVSSPQAESAPAAPPAAQETPLNTAKESPGAVAAETPVQPSKAASETPAKADHRWLAESLWRRVKELKRYPSSARLNGQEGKVVLKAVIRSDGHLIDVTIQKSSGHQILDAAAIEAVKLACPLHMKQEINRPEIVVSLPIVYSLAN